MRGGVESEAGVLRQAGPGEGLQVKGVWVDRGVQRGVGGQIQAHAEPCLSLGTTGPEPWEFSRSFWEVLACLGRFPVLRLPGHEGREGVQEGREMLNGGVMRLSPHKPSEWLFCVWFVPLSGTGSQLPLAVSVTSLHFRRKYLRQTVLPSLKSEHISGHYLGFWVFSGQSTASLLLPLPSRSNDSSMGGGVEK